MVNYRGYAKLTGFGLVKGQLNYWDKTSTLCGPLHYLAPEMISAVYYGRIADWWMLGIGMYYMLLRKVTTDPPSIFRV